MTGLRYRIVGDDFSSLMERYVGMDLVEDRIGDEEKTHEINKVISELVQKVIEEPNLLKQELAWLVNQEAKNGYMFGYNLCQFAKDLNFLPFFLDAQKKSL